MIQFVQDNKIDLTIVGPENPLASGIVDTFRKYNLNIFGPDAFCAQLESSKVFARDVMAEYNIPHPKYYACKNKEEAIEIANNSQYGLGGSLWTSDIALAKDVVRKINTGAIFINEMTKSDPRLPFGGIKKSGYGIELSKHGIREFVNIKTIVVN